MEADRPTILEQDGDIVRIVAGEIEVIAQMTRGPDEILFDRVSVDGAGPGSVGLAKLRTLARQFAQQCHPEVLRGISEATGVRDPSEYLGMTSAARSNPEPYNGSTLCMWWHC